MNISGYVEKKEKGILWVEETEEGDITLCEKRVDPVSGDTLNPERSSLNPKQLRFMKESLQQEKDKALEDINQHYADLFNSVDAIERDYRALILLALDLELEEEDNKGEEVQETEPLKDEAKG